MHGPGTKCPDIRQKENTKNLPTNPETAQASRHLSLMQMCDSEQERRENGKMDVRGEGPGLLHTVGKVSSVSNKALNKSPNLCDRLWLIVSCNI